MDQQLINFLGNKGILCIPMRAKNAIIGSVVLGIDEITACKGEQLRYCNLFISQIALALSTIEFRQSEFNGLNNSLKKIQEIPAIEL